MTTPRPLYVNHPRTEPAVGDVVSTSDGADGDPILYVHTGLLRYAGVRPYGDYTSWIHIPSGLPDGGPLYAAELTLLVDGTTGQVVR